MSLQEQEYELQFRYKKLTSGLETLLEKSILSLSSQLPGSRFLNADEDR